MIIYEAINRYGSVVRTFSHEDQAEEFRRRMEALGSPMSVRRTRHVKWRLNHKTELYLKRA